MSGPALGFFTAALVALVVVSLYEGYRVLLSACQWFSIHLLAGGSPTAAPPSKAGLAVDQPDWPTPEQPDVYRSSHGRLLSSPPPARRSADLESAAFLPLTLAVIDPSPNLSAFSAGIELAIFTALATISSLLVVAWIVKTMRSSNR